MMRRPVIGDALAGFSLASLWFVREFQLAFYATDFGYFGRIPPRPVENVGLLIAVLSLAGVYFLLFRAVNLAKNLWLARALRIGLLLFGLLAFGSPSSEAITWFYPYAVSYLHLPLPIAVLVGCTALAYTKRFSLTAIVTNLRIVALIVAPFGLLLCGQDLILAMGTEPPQPVTPTIERPAVKNPDSRVKNRVIWIIFDEMGRAPLMNRPDWVKMPAIDRLMSGSFVAENAFPPNYFTRFSVVAMLTGRPIKSTEPVSSNDIRLHGVGDEPPTLLSETENAVTDTKALGGNVAIIGWWVPYTKHFEKELSYGYPSPPQPPCSMVLECSWEKFVHSLEGLPYFGRWVMADPSLDVGGSTTKQIERNSVLRTRALELAPDPNLDLCYFHFSIPHSPFITRSDEPATRGYYDALEAVDRNFGELRQRLESAGQWDNTTVIVSADHWWRVKGRSDFAHLPEDQRGAAVADRRVPFIVKLPGQTSAVPYSPAFNTVITRYLINAIMTGEVNTPDQLAKWLDKMAVERPDLVNFRAN